MNFNEIKNKVKFEIQIKSKIKEKMFFQLVSNFEELIGNNIIITTPLYRGEVYNIMSNTNIDVFFMQDNNLYLFSAIAVSNYKKGAVSYLKILIKSQIQQVQKREFFRFNYMTPARYKIVESYHKENNSIVFNKCVVKNLSGGGLCIGVEEDIDKGKLIECHFEMGTNKKVKITGRVVWVVKIDENQNEIGIWFEEVDEVIREDIIRFIFESQRNLIKHKL